MGPLSRSGRRLARPFYRKLFDCIQLENTLPWDMAILKVGANSALKYVLFLRPNSLSRKSHLAPLRLQLCILFSRQTEPYSTAAHSDPLVQHQSAFLVRKAATAFDHLDDLPRRREFDLPGECGPEIGLQEMAMPGVPELKRHIHSTTILLAGHPAIIGEQTAKLSVTRITLSRIAGGSA